MACSWGKILVFWLSDFCFMPYEREPVALVSSGGKRTYVRSGRLQGGGGELQKIWVERLQLATVPR